MFPSDWSPPPVEFLNLKALQADRAAPVQRQVDTVGPWSLRRLAHQLPEGLQQEPQDSDSTEHLASLEELFWNMAGTSPKAAAPEVDTRTSFTSGGSECYVNSLDYLLQEKREQALEQEREKLLLQDCPHLNSSDPDEDEVPLALEHSSPPAQQLSFLRSGLLSGLYLHVGDRPEALLRWLFQLLTWPPETSLGAFGLLWDLSVDGLIRQSDEDTYLWCPSLQEVTAAFHSLGARSPALHPLGPFQHSGSKANLSQCEQQDTPGETALDISLSHICKFLMLCALAQPGAYPDGSLLGLIELICQAGLDVGLRLLPKTDLQQLLLLLLENIQEWPGKLRPLCCALSQVSDHHHNLLALVQLFPDVTSRSRQLRSQLSLVVIARMLDQQETLPLWQEKAQLSSLIQLLGLMRPSSLGQYLRAEILPPGQDQQPKASAQLDHKVCYLCHSLLTLAGVVVSCQDITPDRWGELQLLCMQLDRHISTHIRESPQAMYWTRLKDLATQTYIRWQELLAHCQPQTPYFSTWKDS